MTNRISISPIIKSAVSPTDLLKPKGTLTMLPTRNNGHNLFDEVGSLFIVDGDNFHFQLSMDESGLYIERNGEQCVLTPNMLRSKRLNFFVLTWSPSSLRLITAEKIIPSGTNTPESRQIWVEQNTVPCSVPLSLKRWARDKSLIPNKIYNSETDFRDAVHQCLADLVSKVEDNGATESFWDYSYDGNRIKGKKPKKETLAQPLVKMIIDTELYLRGIDVFRENVTPSGDVDFTVVASVKTFGVANMCIELKNAHSDYLENGLLNQLPDYMRSQNSQYGAYCVLNYNVEKSDGCNISRPALIEKLNLWKVASSDDLVKTKIRIFVIDLDTDIISSKRK
jgi:hypothetical protein